MHGRGGEGRGEQNQPHHPYAEGSSKCVLLHTVVDSLATARAGARFRCFALLEQHNVTIYWKAAAALARDRSRAMMRGQTALQLISSGPHTTSSCIHDTILITVHCHMKLITSSSLQVTFRSSFTVRVYSRPRCTKGNPVP